MKLTKTLALVALLVSPVLVTAHEYEAGNLHIDHPWSREMPPIAPTAAVYFVVQNKGDNADRLLSVDTPAAGKAELHEHLHQDGVMKMQQVSSVEIPATTAVAFAPMGYHVMLFNLPRQFKDGERFPMTLHFEQAGAVQVEVAVQKEPPAEHGEHKHQHAQ
ncbi:copper chaperone PCu(A)C [Aquipseudomonas campi]|uniref:Copper chaperone PCu(A)C n=1 Tax=Aquipseudomonas campi TaxID=2731681 RepID=A0A6M8F427_9GAMM|nr:copper chaperone PCu(A)C [Pseudomonas campi]QKE61911.1 copper chaperone PCu(A)C [Pseudomonas campi]